MKLALDHSFIVVFLTFFIGYHKTRNITDDMQDADANKINWQPKYGPTWALRCMKNK